MNKKKRTIKDEILKQFELTEAKEDNPFLPVFSNKAEKTLQNEIVIDYNAAWQMISIRTTFPEIIEKARDVAALQSEIPLGNGDVLYMLRVHQDLDMIAAVAHCFQAALAVAQDIVIVGKTFDIWKGEDE